jgi:hypothetical protein
MGYSYMTNLSDFLKPSVQNKQTLAIFCVVVFLVATPSAMLIVGLTNHLLSSLGLYDARWASRSNMQVSGFDIFGTVLLAPILETLMLSWLINATSKFISKKFLIALTAAIVFATLHGFTSIFWFFGPLWLFFVMSYAYMIWRSHSYGYAFTAACVPHMLNNLTSILGLKFL